jgi:hypothetical protein
MMPGWCACLQQELFYLLASNLRTTAAAEFAGKGALSEYICSALAAKHRLGGLLHRSLRLTIHHHSVDGTKIVPHPEAYM